jgi:hypothetical protein
MDAFDYTHLQTLNINAPLTGGPLPQYSVIVKNIHLGKDVDERIQKYFLTKYVYSDMIPKVTVENEGLLIVKNNSLYTIKGMLVVVFYDSNTEYIVSEDTLSIYENAFAYCNMKKIVFPEGLETIPKCFNSNSSVVEIHLPSTIKTIVDLRAGYHLNKIYCKSTNPPVCSFSESGYGSKHIDVYCPVGCIDMYKNN